MYSQTPFERPPNLERPLDNVNLNINVLISTPDEKPPHLKGHFSDAKGVSSQEGFHYIPLLLTPPPNNSKLCIVISHKSSSYLYYILSPPTLNYISL